MIQSCPCVERKSKVRIKTGTVARHDIMEDTIAVSDTGNLSVVHNFYRDINISALRCNKSFPEDVYALSKYCYYATDLDSTECFPKTFFTDDPMDYNIQLFTSLWIIFVGIIGVIGNSLTIVAIPYNMTMKRYFYTIAN